MTARYDWLPTECAPARFPITVVHGALKLNDGSSVPLPFGITMRNGWGELGPQELIGEVRKPVPTRLDLTWFSFAEDRFFRGRFELAHTSLETLFAVGFQSPSRAEVRTYNTIIVGMAPGGVVSIWVAGEGLVRAVAIFHAQPAEVDWKRVIDNPAITREAYVDLVLKNALSADDYHSRATREIPFGAWDRAARQYDLVPLVVGAESRTSVWINYVNGEREFIDLTGNGSASKRPRASMTEFEIRFTNHGGTRYSATVSLEEAESMAAVEKLAEANPGQALSLVVDISHAPTAVKVSLRDDLFLLELTKVTTQFFTE